MKIFRYLFHMIPVLWSLIRDIVFRSLSREENRLHYFLGKANAYDQADLSDRSIRIYEEILKKDPDSIPVFMNIGGICFRRGMFEKAIPYYEKVVGLNTKHYQGHYWLAVCYWKLERYYAAINTLEEVIEFLPTFKDALNLMGDCYEKVGEGAKAEHYYLKAISADPDGRVIQAGILNRSIQEKKREERVRH
ncbi:MAG: tetratricopeptide repeat protein [Deltaproteobacteria bacterium]|nr:tetratricopeptide repeat protein [Deltaproteobacteria bacterium]